MLINCHNEVFSDGVDLLCIVKRGNTPAKPYRAKLLALEALATTFPVNVSVVYCMVLTKTHRFPHAKGMMAAAGLAQEISLRAVQANQKRPRGKPKLPSMAG